MSRDDVRDELVHLRDEAAILLEAYLARPVLRGISHLVGFFAAVAGTLALVVQAGAAIQLAASLIYGVGLAAMLGTSATFHRVRWRPRAYRWVRKLDHSMIFVVIASTYTPFVLLLLDGWFRVAALSFVWCLTAVGVTLRIAIDDLPRALQVAMYHALGWSALAVFPALWEASTTALALALAGGVLYTLGSLAYLYQRPNPLPRWFGFHEVFHACVVAAAACHFLAVYPLVTGPLAA